mgnify:CR=1 FL=1
MQNGRQVSGLWTVAFVLELLLDVFSSQIRHLEIIDPSVDVSKDHYLQKVQTTGTSLLFLRCALNQWNRPWIEVPPVFATVSAVIELRGILVRQQNTV